MTFTNEQQIPLVTVTIKHCPFYASDFHLFALVCCVDTFPLASTAHCSSFWMTRVDTHTSKTAGKVFVENERHRSTSDWKWYPSASDCCQQWQTNTMKPTDITESIIEVAFVYKWKATKIWLPLQLIHNLPPVFSGKTHCHEVACHGCLVVCCNTSQLNFFAQNRHTTV